MKNLIALLLTFGSLTASAQSVYESPFVDDGTSFKFSIPYPFLENDMGLTEMTMFVRGVPTNGTLEPNFEGDWFSISIAEGNDRTNIKGMLEEVRSWNDDITEEVRIDSITSVTGHVFHTAEGLFDKFTEDPIPSYMANTNFHGMTITVSWFDLDDGTSIDRNDFVTFVQSFTEYQTDRENTFQVFEVTDYEPSTEGMTTFFNEGRETGLYYEFLSMFPHYEKAPEFIELWEEDWRVDYPELLSAYYYVGPSTSETQSAGAKLFSCGIESAGLSTIEMTRALQETVPSHYIEAIKEIGPIKGDYFDLTEYKVISSSYQFAVQSLYVAEIENETVLILLYVLEAPTKEFMNNLEIAVQGLNYHRY